MQKKITVSMDWFINDWDLRHEKVKLKKLTGKPSSHQPGNIILRLQSYSSKWQVNNLNMFRMNNKGSWAKAVNGFKPFGKL